MQCNEKYYTEVWFFDCRFPEHESACVALGHGTISWWDYLGLATQERGFTLEELTKLCAWWGSSSIKYVYTPTREQAEKARAMLTIHDTLEFMWI